jgi:hypothetical protein
MTVILQQHNMAASHVSASSLDNLNFLAKCVDTNTIKSLKDKAHLIYEGNRIKWTQDLDSLKYLSKISLALTVGGDHLAVNLSSLTVQTPI